MPTEQQEFTEGDKVVDKIEDYNVKVMKYIPSGKDYLEVKLVVNEPLRQLLEYFVVKTGTKSTVITTFNDREGHIVESRGNRYLIKSILHNSCSLNGYTYALFTTNLIDKGWVKFKMGGQHHFEEYLRQMGYYRDLIKVMEELRAEQVVEITFSVE